MDEPGLPAAREVAERFYAAFARRDAETMAACYAVDCEFRDPAFGVLFDDEVRAMWHMLAARARGFSLQFEVTDADAARARVTWRAEYLFSATGRPVRNEVTSELELEGGLIKRHTDRFDLYKWSRMALGWKGTLLGWAPPVQRALRKRARRQLAEWRAARFNARK